jgi:hypothetical protein
MSWGTPKWFGGAAAGPVAAKAAARSAPEAAQEKAPLAVDSVYELLANPPDAEWQRRRWAMDEIVGVESLEGVGDQDEVPHDVSFAAFLEQHAEWAAPAPAAYVAFRDDACGIEQLVQRVQLHGNCAVHAPVVLQHYLVSRANKRPMPTVAIPDFLREHASKDVLSGIASGTGSDPVAILRAIAAPGSRLHECAFGNIADALRRYGPVLLPAWRVTSELRDASQWQHLGAPAPTAGASDLLGLHSMLVVGARQAAERNGETRLLVQNWWRGKQFFELDEAFYAACAVAPARFVVDIQPSIRAIFATTDSPFSVTASDSEGVRR